MHLKIGIKDIMYSILTYIDPPDHSYPVSIVHTSLHPSELTMLPSSHCSEITCKPSPQIGSHVSADDVVPFSHNHPVSTVHVLPIY